MHKLTKFQLTFFTITDGSRHKKSARGFLPQAVSQKRSVMKSLYSAIAADTVGRKPVPVAQIEILHIQNGFHVFVNPHRRLIVFQPA